MCDDMSPRSRQSRFILKNCVLITTRFLFFSLLLLVVVVKRRREAHFSGTDTVLMKRGPRAAVRGGHNRAKGLCRGARQGRYDKIVDRVISNSGFAPIRPVAP